MNLHPTCACCGRDYPWSAPVWRCDCGGHLSPVDERRFDPASIETANPSLWRYRAFLGEAPPVTLGEGWTPLVEGTAGGRRVLYKLDYVMPTASFKDRGASLLTSRLRAAGVGEVVEDSSGNAGSALACYCARAGIGCTIYCPESTSPGKTLMMAAVGARVVRVPGPRQAAAEAVLEAARGSFYASHVLDPAYPVGTATAAWEIAEQLGWRAPEAVVAPVGNGTLVLGLALGFARLAAAGVIDRVPRLIAAQAAQCGPLASAFAQGQAEPAAIEARPTAAEGIAIARPARGTQILAAVRAGGGTIVAVTEAGLVAALGELHRQGLFVEPTSTVAAAAAADAGAGPRDDVVVILTGSGLKAGERIAELLRAAG